MKRKHRNLHIQEQHSGAQLQRPRSSTAGPYAMTNSATTQDARIATHWPRKLDLQRACSVNTLPAIKACEWHSEVQQHAVAAWGAYLQP